MTDVKRAFVLADKLKAGPFDSRELFLNALERCSAEVVEMTKSLIDSRIGCDQRRLRDYNRATWTFGTFHLSHCVVWPCMGSRSWAVGTPATVAALFKSSGPQDSRVWTMKQYADIYASKLPIIIIDRGTEVRIDDGSHRAVAMALAGITQTSAWVGVLKAANHRVE